MLTTNASLMDGINRHILSVASSLNQLPDCEVVVCTVMPWNELNEALSENNVKSYAWGFPHGHDYKILSAFKEIVCELKPDVIHIHVLSIMERIYLSFLGRKIPLVETIHGISDSKSEKSLRDKLESMICNLSPLHIAARCYVSKGVKDVLQDSVSLCAINEVSYNPISFAVDQKTTPKLRSELSLSPDTLLVGTACRISYVKNPQAFTEVMCLVLSKNTSVHAVVIGDGDRAIIAECHKIVEKYGCLDRFHWLGYRKDAPSLVSELDCFVMTSRSEGMPTAVLECFASRTPVAMLHGNGGLKDIIDLNSNTKPIVLHSPSDTYEDLANQISHLLRNDSESKMLTDNAFDIGRKNFSLEAVTHQLHEIYQKVLK